MDNYELFKKLYFAKDENEIEVILKKENLWNDPGNWRDIGDNPSNWTIIGGQQKDPLNALIEKLINVGDSILLNKCKEIGIDPEDLSKAPISLSKAVEKFLSIPGGDLSNIQASEITKLAHSTNGMMLSESSNPAHPNFTIFDFGEGQAPENFPETFMSLANSNKIKIPFVQGKHCAGSSGVFRFCNHQLILSRRNPKIRAKDESDKFGFTVTRCFPASKNTRNPVAKYLVINGHVPQFSFNGPLKLLCSTDDKYIQKFNRDFSYGSIVKIFNYKIGTLPGQKNGQNLAGGAAVTLRKALNRKLISPAVPLRIFDQRPSKQGGKRNSHQGNVDGLMRKITLDKKNELEKNMPIGISIRENGQLFNIQVYVLKNEANKSSWHKDDGIMYCLNGQVNSVQNSSIFKSKRIRLGNFSSNIFVIVDCSLLDNNHICKMFQNNREALSKDDFVLNFQEKLYDEISNHSELKRLSREYDKKLGLKNYPNKNINLIFDNLRKKFTPLGQLLFPNSKGKIKIPGGNNQGAISSFSGSKFPTYFNIKKQYLKNKPKKAELGRDIRVEFLTDAENDFLTRNIDPGRFDIVLGGVNYTKKCSFIASNGLWTLKLPIRNLRIGGLYKIEVSLIDKVNNNTFKENFNIKVENLIIKNPSKSNKKNTFSNYNLSDQVKVKKGDPLYDSLGLNNDHAYCIQYGSKKGEYLYFLNMDNTYLQNMKLQYPEKAEKVQQFWETSNLINQMSIANFDKKNPNKITDIEEFSKDHSETSQFGIFTSALMGSELKI